MSTSKKILFAFLTALLVIGLIEATARTYWAVRYRVPPWGGERILGTFYPEIQPIFKNKVAVESREPRILMLGASALTTEYGNIPRLTAEKWTRLSGRSLALINAARSSLTSRDSLIKYRHLGDYRFDLVIAYDSVNETRANNIPPELFKKDYSHYAWYDLVGAYERHPEIKWFMTPFMLECLRIHFVSTLGLKRYVPGEIPAKDWVRRAGPVQTAETLTANLEEMRRLAEQRRTRLMVMTVGYFKAPGYTREAFEAGQLGYSKFGRAQVFPIELWGDPDFVERALREHNDAIRRFAQEHPDVLFLDMERLMPKEGRYFIDLCHFSAEGIARFTEILSRVLWEKRGRWLPEARDLAS